MILYLIRHGEPDYVTDRLLPAGWEQARAAAVRLAAGGIDEIHASPMGRARETAAPLAEKLGLPVIVEPWAYELGEEAKCDWPEGERHNISDFPGAYYHGKEFVGLSTEEALEKIPPMTSEGYRARVRELTEGLDGFLANLGYRRTPDGLYETDAPSSRHVALFCHAAMMRVLLSHLYHVPVQLFAASLYGNFTGITILSFGEEKGPLVPRLVSYGDVGHLYGSGQPLVHYITGETF